MDETNTLLSVPLGYQNGRNDSSESSIQDDKDISVRYNWRQYSPKGDNDRKCLPFLRWLVVGGASYAKQTDEELQRGLEHLAQCLLLLREYKQKYGIPFRGGPRDQELVLRTVYKDLYAGGAPIWALGPVMQKASEGLTGDADISWLLLPRRALMEDPWSGATSMITAERGFDMRKLDATERVAVRLVSFSTNTRGANNVPTRLPNPKELAKAAHNSTSTRMLLLGRNNGNKTLLELDRERLAAKILKLASGSESIFFFTNMDESLNQKGTNGVTLSPTPPHEKADRRLSYTESGDGFWIVSESERDLFSRLATVEALQSLDRIHKETKVLYPNWSLNLFRMLASAGACGFWFHGSWYDMLIAGILALVVAFIGTVKSLSKQERVVFEIVDSFLVGLTAGLIALQWPNDTCFAAMALGGVLHIFQGFRIVYSIIEIMSKHTVAGGANFFEGILFTGLIAYFLRFGQYVAAAIMGDASSTQFLECTNGINVWWYFLLVPLASFSWSALFNPNYKDLPAMCFHGSLAVGINWGLGHAGVAVNVNLFVSALVVSFCAGVFSRFDGRQAVGNTVAAIYALVPGAYLVRSLLSTKGITGTFFLDIVQRSVIIGLGAWTGTILCSHAVLGTTQGLISQQEHRDEHGSERSVRQTNTLLFF